MAMATTTVTPLLIRLWGYYSGITVSTAMATAKATATAMAAAKAMAMCLLFNLYS